MPGPISEISDRGEGEGEDATISRREQYPEWRLSLVSAINHDYYYLLCIIIIALPRLPLPESVG